MALFFFGGLFLLILFPVSGLLLFLWLLKKKKIFLKILIGFWLTLFGLIFLLCIIAWCYSKTILDKDDYYGTYIVDRSYFKGAQADWQYDHFRFEIMPNDSIYFYVTEKDHIVQTYRGTISTTDPYGSARLILKMEQPAHHIVATNPTTYRSAWDFHLVFFSSIFNNMYFKKGEWEPLDK